MQRQEELDFSPKAREITGEELKQKGIASVLSNTPNEYKLSFERSLDTLARRMGNFTCEHIRGIIGDPPNHPSALSALINGALKRKLIRKVGITKATRAPAHSALIGIYSKVDNV